jgi:ribosome-associated protein
MSEAGSIPLPPATGSIDSQTGSLVRNVLANLEDAKAENIVSIDLRGKTSIADVMVIATGRSNTHVGAIAERVIKACKDRGLVPRVEGMPNCDWVLVDVGDAIVHVFRPEARQFYNLEKMWGGDRPAERSQLRAV